MKLSDIVVHLAAQLPRYTNKFHNVLSYNDIEDKGDGLVEVTTQNAHNLKDGAYITINNVRAARRIISIEAVSLGLAYAEVDGDHDLTEGWQQQVEISGCYEPEYNGFHNLVSVPNRKSFSFEVPHGIPDYATGTDMKLHERLEVGLEGVYTVKVISDNKFSIEVSPDLQIDFTQFNGVIARGQRIIGSINFERFVELYEKHQPDNYYAVVCMDDAFNSKDRNAVSDAIANSSIQTELRSVLIEPFSVYVFIPTQDQLAGIKAIDDVYEEIRNALYKSLYGYKFPTGLSSGVTVGVQPTAHGMVYYNKSYYVHQFRFETYKEITQQDSAYHTGNIISPTKAFRDIILKSQNEFSTDLIGTNINLDDVPLPPHHPLR